MGDRKKRDLQRLEDALWEEDFPVPEEDGELSYEEEPELQRRRRKTRASQYGRTIYDDEAFDENAAVVDTSGKPKGIGCLVFLAFLELAGIVGVALWWLKCLL